MTEAVQAPPPGPPQLPPAAPDPGHQSPTANADTSKPASNPMRKIILGVIALLLLLFLYHVIADRFTPYSSQARVDTFLTQIAPEVAGDVLEVGVKDNSPVRKGQLLFHIDPEPYELAVRAAEANLAVALQAADVSVADISAAQAQVQRQRVDLSASRKLGKIVTDLVDKKALAETQAIRAIEDIGTTEADLSRAQADLRKAQASLGAPGFANPKVRQAVAALEQARLDLRNTRVMAPADGIVTNLRLAPGQFVNTGQPLLSFLENGPRWISADMRENQLGNVKPGNEVLVAFDVRPGKVFRGRVHSVGWGITQGDETPTGQLPSVSAQQGWLREPQRFPVRIAMLPDDDEDFDAGRSGAQVNVVVLTEEDSIMNPIGRFWIKLVALLSYLR